MLTIEAVEPGSYAEQIGFLAGDKIISINGKPITDFLDYYLQMDSETVEIEVLHEQESWDVSLDKEADEDIGLLVEHPPPRQCGNQCLFCFVHQLPKGMRRTLYIKDEDYRFSYLYGSYITLTNVQDADIERIVREKLSPLYVSIHATDPHLRQQLLGVPVADIMPLVERLTDAGIVFHCQIVLCPGYNDGEVLAQTIEDLYRYFPGVASLAIVPVGLTRHREGLPALRELTVEDASRCLSVVGKFQERFLAESGSRFVFAADEIYLLANEEIPPLETYEDCAQIENGVGMIAWFRQQAEEVLLEADPLDLKKVTLVTGASFVPELREFAERLALRTGVRIEVLEVENNFFGKQVTVTGLVTGSDLIRSLNGIEPGQAVLLPEILLKPDEGVFLDDMTVSDIRRSCHVPVEVIESSPWGLLEGLESLAYGNQIIHCRD